MFPGKGSSMIDSQLKTVDLVHTRCKRMYCLFFALLSAAYCVGSCIDCRQDCSQSHSNGLYCTLYLFLSAMYRLALYISSSRQSNQSAGNSEGSMSTPPGLMIPGRPPLGLKYMLHWPSTIVSMTHAAMLQMNATRCLANTSDLISMLCLCCK